MEGDNKDKEKKNNDDNTSEMSNKEFSQNIKNSYYIFEMDD